MLKPAITCLCNLCELLFLIFISYRTNSTSKICQNGNSLMQAPTLLLCSRAAIFLAQSNCRPSCHANSGKRRLTMATYLHGIINSQDMLNFSSPGLSAGIYGVVGVYKH